MHGIVATAEDMDELTGWIRETYPGIYVRSIEIGNESQDSLFMPMIKEVELFCQQIFVDDNWKDGFNLLGFSEGSLITRAAVQRRSFPKVYSSELCEFVTKYVYIDYVQKLISFAGYWRDHYQLGDYYAKSQFAIDINNERKRRNETYRQNLLKLNAFVMTYSDIDTPRQSDWFMSYAPNLLKVQLWNDSREFPEDLVELMSKSLNLNPTEASKNEREL
ncbi:unnamed protein product [Didymodactylos carnosus]|uniref:Uncharacterized protein n=1 Tax=Didymodactylos carnosus TaxID=1234261 RepID=A0A815BR30_9BILA|nr:unnamed protein product [Didymodactylos carnosus]CAF1415501.1 unnamed protein product [Didymodactylos carnosus]CAF4065898.1 unnamed protein product [Didymodactylos carnosus]CAF4217942.1 unnamed protein product [Didymodactylos carnosus]